MSSNILSIEKDIRDNETEYLIKIEKCDDEDLVFEGLLSYFDLFPEMFVKIYNKYKEDIMKKGV